MRTCSLEEGFLRCRLCDTNQDISDARSLMKRLGQTIARRQARKANSTTGKRWRNSTHRTHSLLTQPTQCTRTTTQALHRLRNDRMSPLEAPHYRNIAHVQLFSMPWRACWASRPNRAPFALCHWRRHLRCHTSVTGFLILTGANGGGWGY